MNTLWVVAVLATQPGVQAPDPEDVTPGLLGFAMFIALFVATVLLWLSMRRQLKKVNFIEEPDPQPRPEPDPSEQARG